MSTDVGIAGNAHRLSVRRLRLLGEDPGSAERREGRGWYAVRTGTASNELNGVASTPQAEVTPALVDDLVGWFAAADAPAVWLLEAPDPRAVAVLTERGAHAETTGRWAGGGVRETLDACRRVDGVDVVRVTDTDLETWLDLAGRCGWLEDDRDRATRRRVMVGQLGQAGWSHWLAREGGEPVGFASAYVAGDSVDLCNVGVLPDRRRRGVGTALAAARLRDAADRGARHAVCAPSPDGWALYRTLGWANVPVEPDTCCYLPSR